MDEKLNHSINQGIHAQLAKLIGNWEGTTKVWFEPDKIADESPVKGSIRTVLGGRFVLHEYAGAFGEKALEGIAIYGYHLMLDQFQTAWIDSFHNGTAIMFSEGGRGNNAFNVTGNYSYISDQVEVRWGWRTELKLINDNELLITAYNVSPEGEEARATETHYKRVS